MKVFCLKLSNLHPTRGQFAGGSAGERPGWLRLSDQIRSVQILANEQHLRSVESRESAQKCRI